MMEAMSLTGNFNDVDLNASIYPGLSLVQMRLFLHH